MLNKAKNRLFPISLIIVAITLLAHQSITLARPLQGGAMSNSNTTAQTPIWNAFFQATSRPSQGGGTTYVTPSNGGTQSSGSTRPSQGGGVQSTPSKSSRPSQGGGTNYVTPSNGGTNYIKPINSGVQSIPTNGTRPTQGGGTTYTTPRNDGYPTYPTPPVYNPPTYNTPPTYNPPVYRPPVTRTPSRCLNHPYPTDIDGHWAEIFIRRLYDLCITEGYADGSYRPQQNVTRAELTKMALFAAGIKPNPGCYDNDCGSPFIDLDRWQGPWIRPAWDRHIVEGHGHRFYPNRAITRAEATKIILASFGATPLWVDQSFFNDVHGWSTGWIERAHEDGIIDGVGNGNFDPERPITRAEAAKIIAKTIEYFDTHIRTY